MSNAPSTPPEQVDQRGTIPSHEFVQIAASVFERVSIGAMITDAEGRIVSVNNAFSAFTGYSAGEVIGKKPSLLQSGRQDARFYAEMWQTLRQRGHWSGIVWNRKKNGAHYAELLNISSIYSEDGHVTHYIGTFSDITYTQEYAAHLEHLAHYDSLTDLPNRVLLADRLQQAMTRVRRQSQRLAVGYLDLDNFKPINDLYGHLTGDEVLISVARRLSSCLRDSDTLARIGGDEFAILLCDLGEDGAHEATFRRLLQALEPPFHVSGQTLTVQACIGATLYPADFVSAETLLHHADIAMYAAKHQGGNGFRMYQQDMQKPTVN